uniref:Evasin n=1 Tax=Amblyomma cajennense TaxID=34607 RepID=A0A023FC67_AMBCJ
MHLAALLTCLLVFFGSAACQDLTEEDSTALIDVNGTDDNAHPLPPDFLPINGTEQVGNSTGDEGTEASTPEEPIVLGIITEGGPRPDATTTTSATTTTVNISSTAEATSASTTRTKRTRRPRPTKKTKRPHPKEDEKYGTLIDSKGCEHKVLQSKHDLYTATCTGTCRGRTYPIVDGTPCLHAVRRSPRLNKGGKKCLKGVCRRGRCQLPFKKEVKCQVPKGTVHYYDDNGGDYNYNDDINHGTYYDYDNSYEGVNYNHRFAE